jgi:hypothetical protein
MAGLVVVLALAGAAEAAAQASAEAPRLRAGRPTVSGGGLVTGGYPIGAAAAELRQNVPGTTAPPPFTLFRASTDVARATGLDLRVTWPLSSALAFEAATTFSRPGLAVAISNDPEAPPTTIDESRLSQYAIEGALVWQIPTAALGARARPYVTAGGGYLRQLYDERTRVETGQLYHLGGGVRYWLRGGDGRARDVGIRGEVRYQRRRGGVEFEEKARAFPVVSASVFVGL